MSTPLHQDASIYARYGLEPAVDSDMLRSLGAFAERKGWPRTKVLDLLNWEKGARVGGLLANSSQQELYNHAVEHLEARGWSADDVFAAQAWHEGVVKHGPQKAWPIGRGDSEEDTMATHDRARLEEIRAYRRNDPTGKPGSTPALARKGFPAHWQTGAAKFG